MSTTSSNSVVLFSAVPMTRFVALPKITSTTIGTRELGHHRQRHLEGALPLPSGRFTVARVTAIALFRLRVAATLASDLHGDIRV